MGFEEMHVAFIRSHLERRSGERRGRLERGHLHAEKLFLQNVWWSLKGNFDHLHPEFEVLDWRGRSYFADFAYLNGGLKLLIEIKGFASHVKDMDRKRYCNELNREVFLQAIGYRVISFAYDDVAHEPDLVITLLSMVLNRYQQGEKVNDRQELMQTAVIGLAFSLAKPIRPKDVTDYLLIDHRTAVKILHSLCHNRWLRPRLHGDGRRIRSYELIRGAFESI
jgi:hypothetical protein